MDLTAVAIGVVLFVLLLPNAYSAWFTPDKYRKGMRKARARLQGHPESIFYGDLERHPKLDINLARAGYLFGLLFIGVFIVVAIRGPF